MWLIELRVGVLAVTKVADHVRLGSQKKFGHCYIVHWTGVPPYSDIL